MAKFIEIKTTKNGTVYVNPDAVATIATYSQSGILDGTIGLLINGQPIPIFEMTGFSLDEEQEKEAQEAVIYMTGKIVEITGIAQATPFKE